MKTEIGIICCAHMYVHFSVRNIVGQCFWGMLTWISSRRRFCTFIYHNLLCVVFKARGEETQLFEISNPLFLTKALFLNEKMFQMTRVKQKGLGGRNKSNQTSGPQLCKRKFWKHNELFIALDRVFLFPSHWRWKNRFTIDILGKKWPRVPWLKHQSE